MITNLARIYKRDLVKLSNFSSLGSVICVACRRFIAYLMTVRKPSTFDSFKFPSNCIPLKLPTIVKQPILCRYCSTEIPIFESLSNVVNVANTIGGPKMSR